MVIAALGTVLAAGYLLWLYQRTAFGTPTEEFADEHIHDVHVDRVDRLGADARAHPRARRLPEPHLPRHRPGHDRAWATPSRRWASSRSCSPPSCSRERRSSGPTSTSTRSRPRSCSPARIVVVLLVDLFTPERRARASCRRSPASACSPRWSRCSPSPSTAPTASMFGGAYVGRQLRARAQGAVPARRATSSCCCRTNYIAEGDYWEGEYYFLLLVARSSA